MWFRARVPRCASLIQEVQNGLVGGVAECPSHAWTVEIEAETSIAVSMVAEGRLLRALYQ